MPRIVMGAGSDPVGSGFVTSLARPGGNGTGVSLLQTDLVDKQLQLLKEVVPRASRIGMLSLGGPNPSMKKAEAAAPHHGVKLHASSCASPLDDVRIRIVEIINAQRLPSLFFLAYWRRPAA